MFDGDATRKVGLVRRGRVSGLIRRMNLHPKKSDNIQMVGCVACQMTPWRFPESRRICPLKFEGCGAIPLSVGDYSPISFVETGSTTRGGRSLGSRPISAFSEIRSMK